MKDDKRGVSPLIATVLLVMIVVSIGASIMMVIRDMTETNLEKSEQKAVEIQCGTDVKPKIVEVGGVYKYCLDRDSSILSVMIENVGSVNIEDWKITVVGTSMFYSNESIYGRLDKGAIKVFNYTLNNSHIDVFQKIRILPVVKGSASNPLVVCSEPSLEWDQNEIDEIPECPMS